MDISYYDKFSRVFDVLSPRFYYHSAREEAIERLGLRKGDTVLNVPIGTGQNFDYFQNRLEGTGKIVGVDLSTGMLSKAFAKVKDHKYSNVDLLNMNASDLNADWLAQYREDNPDFQIDAILCDLGLSGFEDWEDVIDNLIGLLKPQGRISVMDWEIQEPSFRGELIKWIGGEEVDRPIPAYLQSRLDDYDVDHSFNRGGVFVASGIKPAGMGD